MIFDKLNEGRIYLKFARSLGDKDFEGVQQALKSAERWASDDFTKNLLISDKFGQYNNERAINLLCASDSTETVQEFLRLAEKVGGKAFMRELLTVRKRGGNSCYPTACSNGQLETADVLFKAAGAVGGKELQRDLLTESYEFSFLCRDQNVDMIRYQLDAAREIGGNALLTELLTQNDCASLRWSNSLEKTTLLLSVAQEAGGAELQEKLLKANGAEALFYAVLANDSARLDSLLDTALEIGGKELQAELFQNGYMLVAASRRANTDMIQKMLTLGEELGGNELLRTMLDVTFERANGFEWACISGEMKNVHLLFDAADRIGGPEYQREFLQATDDEVNGFVLASEHGNNEVVEFLLAAADKLGGKALQKELITKFQGAAIRLACEGRKYDDGESRYIETASTILTASCGLDDNYETAGTLMKLIADDGVGEFELNEFMNEVLTKTIADLDDADKVAELMEKTPLRFKRGLEGHAQTITDSRQKVAAPGVLAP